MMRLPVLTAFFGVMLLLAGIEPLFSQGKGRYTPYGKNPIYQKGWIDFNKNGTMDPYEDTSLDYDTRVEDLLDRMTVEEKSCQLATLYGYRKVLTDSLPTPEWKNRVWKDGIANIDEQLNGYRSDVYSWPPSAHAKAINEIQRWFIEETRLGIPVDFTNEGI